MTRTERNRLNGANEGGASGVGRALVLHPFKPRRDGGDREPEDRLEEVVGLARAIRLTIAHAEVVRVLRIRPATLFGKGVVERYRELAEALEVDVVIVDGTLSPVQQRNLEEQLHAKVIDRTALILEIFGERARTHEGRLQVELAALSYQRSRLVRSWTHLERQRGGFGFLGGPGERQIEIDRRLIGNRITKLKRELDTVRRTRGLHRAARKRVPYPVVALVGYTNAGKSTLFNRLTEAEVFAENLMFATLDPTMRTVDLPSGMQIILSDTVGFISQLPTDLIAAFRATLEEVSEADILLHVRDASHPETAAQKRDVEAILGELGLGEADSKPIEVLNKIDLLDDDGRTTVFHRARRDEDAIPISAKTGEGCDDLLEWIDRRLGHKRPVLKFNLDLADGAALAWLYAHGEVLEREDDDRQAHVSVALDSADVARFAHQFDVRPA